jgi:hypothetical protein
MLVEKDGCVYEQDLLQASHGYERLDPVGREAFVNHLHVEGPRHASRARDIVDSWSRELGQGWPGCRFRIYVQSEKRETTVRFHMVRAGVPNWAEIGVEIIRVGA